MPLAKIYAPLADRLGAGCKQFSSAEVLPAFDPAEELSSQEVIAAFMEGALKTGEVGYKAYVLGVFASARGLN